MKRVREMSGFLTISGLAAVILLGLSACQTNEAGVNATPTGAYANVDGSPRQITKTAKAVLKEMSLSPEDSASSAAMGEVIGKTQSGDRITVNVENYTKKTSTVTVSIGGLFEQKPKLAAKIVSRIQAKSNK